MNDLSPKAKKILYPILTIYSLWLAYLLVRCLIVGCPGHVMVKHELESVRIKRATRPHDEVYDLGKEQREKRMDQDIKWLKELFK